MTDQDPGAVSPLSRADVEGLVASWQHYLGLGHWSIAVEWFPRAESDDEDSYTVADVDAHHLPYDRATIRIAERVLDWSPEKWGERASSLSADELIVHELLHVKMAAVDRCVFELPSGMLQPAAADVFERAYDDARERFIDDLARTIVRIHRA